MGKKKRKKMRRKNGKKEWMRERNREGESGKGRRIVRGEREKKRRDKERKQREKREEKHIKGCITFLPRYTLLRSYLHTF